MCCTLELYWAVKLFQSLVQSFEIRGPLKFNSINNWISIRSQLKTHIFQLLIPVLSIACLLFSDLSDFYMASPVDYFYFAISFEATIKCLGQYDNSALEELIKLD